MKILKVNLKKTNLKIKNKFSKNTFEGLCELRDFLFVFVWLGV